MKLARLGSIGNERAALIVSDSEAVFVDDVVGDWSRTSLEAGVMEKIASLDISSRPRVAIADYRLGAPVTRPTKVICVGLNYAQHAIESGATPPPEPIIFMKAPDTVVGGSDDIVVPPGSLKTDYEVEICVVIGKSALYLDSPAQAREHYQKVLELDPKNPQTNDIRFWLAANPG